MKTLVWIAIALFTFNGVAQETTEKPSDRHKKMELRKDMNPKDIADLKSKKLTLKLDLTDAQQKKVHQLILKQAETNQSLRKDRQIEGEKRERPSKEEHVKMQNQRLDDMIIFKRNMKTILTTDQYEKFEKMETRKNKRKGQRSKKQ